MDEQLLQFGVAGAALAITWKVVDLFGTIVLKKFGQSDSKPKVEEHVLWPYMQNLQREVREGLANVNKHLDKMQNGLYGDGSQDGLLTRLALLEKAAGNSDRRLGILEQIILTPKDKEN